MFRRRPFARPWRQAAGGVPPMLRRANELMAGGDYPEAAKAFELLANGAMSRGLPHAPILFLQAGRCRVLAGQVPSGMVLLKKGLALLVERDQTMKLQNAGPRVVADLKRLNLAAEAAEIEAYLRSVLPGGLVTPAASAPAKLRLLPTACPGCGGPIRSDEVEWVDEATAECPFCGSAVRAE